MKYVKQKLLIIFSLIYLFITIFFHIYDIRLFSNIINPIVYTIVSLLIIYKLNKNYIRFKESKYYNFQMFIFTIIYLIVFFYLGFFIGFARSTYSQSLRAILKNIIQFIIPIIGVELIRGIVIGDNRKNKFVIVFITILLILLEIKYSILINNFGKAESFFKYICSTILPLIFSNIVFSYLCFKSSYKLPLIYRIVERIVMLIIPIYPAINWFVTGSFGVLVPVIMFFLFKYHYFKEDKQQERKKGSKIGYVLAISFAVLLVSFMLGLFKYEPIAIVSNSMDPSYSRGDVLIYEKIDKESLKNIPNNSIIVYRVGNQNVAHRIVEVIKDGDVISYRTKGDNNNAPDMRLVEPSQIKGVYVFHIKYIGFPSVWLNDFFNHESAVVETK